MTLEELRYAKQKLEKDLFRRIKNFEDCTDGRVVVSGIRPVVMHWGCGDEEGDSVKVDLSFNDAPTGGNREEPNK